MILALLWSIYKARRSFTVQRPMSGTAMWGFVTIPAGEQWGVCGVKGDVRAVAGPNIICIFGAVLTSMKQFAATTNQSIRVAFVDGRTEIIPGPSYVFKDATVHSTITVVNATSLGEHEVLVVYRKEESADLSSEKDGRVTRSLIRGPCLHVPANASEWTHEFVWHGSTNSTDDAPARKMKGSLCFEKLRTCPDQTYYDVEGVRTRDDALVTVKLMIFYRMKDIEVMLRESHDPIADFVNAVSSDVIDFVAGKTFEEFKASTDQLNELTIYKQLVCRAQNIGFDVTKVVFRGYGAPLRLQKMHDDAIERRTKLALEKETQTQEQGLLDMKLDREEQRQRRMWQTETDEEAHKRKIKRQSHEADQREKLEERQAMLQHLSQLKQELNMSDSQIAAYILALEQGAPQKLIQVVTTESPGNSSSRLPSNGNGNSFIHVQS